MIQISAQRLFCIMVLCRKKTKRSLQIKKRNYTRDSTNWPLPPLPRVLLNLPGQKHFTDKQITKINAHGCITEHKIDVSLGTTLVCAIIINPGL